MKRAEEAVDRMIDALNAERSPGIPDDMEAAELLAVARAVKGLRNPPECREGFGMRLERAVRARPRRRLLPGLAAGLAAALLLGVFIGYPQGGAEPNTVLAMERALANLESYHGVLEKRTLDRAGGEHPVRRLEVWVEGDRYATRDDRGVWTVNNGERRWQVDPERREVAVLPLLPDPRGFDLMDEAERARSYPLENAGVETVAGRRAVRLRIEPPGGDPYDLWIDTETNLPLQLRSAWSNSLQTLYTFTSFEVNAEIDPALFDFDPPDGYAVVEEDPGQLVDTPGEAAAAAGFAPLLPEEAPQRILAGPGRIVLEFDGGTVTETATEEPFEPEPWGGGIGEAAGGPLEVVRDRLRWRQEGLEIRVEGERSIELARQIAPGLVLPERGETLADQAEVSVPVDMEIVANEQRQVDGGHGPWQLDPVQVAMTFVNLKVTPEGIQGEPAIPYSSLRLERSTGAEAVVAVEEGPVARVYLKRPVRQDETGIWWVVGYDPRR